MSSRILAALSVPLCLSTVANPHAQDPFLRSKQRLAPTDPLHTGFLLFSGNSNRALGNEVAQHLGTQLGRAKVSRFADGEISLRIEEDVRGRDAYIMQSTCPPVNDNLMELLLFISALRRSSVKQITAVMPYYGYSRRDRRQGATVPIAAADVAKLLESMGADQVITCDFHSGQTEGFFRPKYPVNNLNPNIIAIEAFKSLGLQSTVIVSPDAAGVYRAKCFREVYSNEVSKATLAIIIRDRLDDSTVSSMELVGSVEGCDVIIVDDIINTAGTVCNAAKLLKAAGAQRILVFATHGLFVAEGLQQIEDSPIEKVVVTNTIPLKEPSRKVLQISVALLLAEAIRRSHQRESFQDLFFNNV